MMMYRGMSISVPGNICDTRKAINPARRAGKRKREKAYAEVQARNTPRKVVSAATMTLLSSHVANGWSAKTERKFSAEKCLGQGAMARNRSSAVAWAGRSAIARLWLPEKAIARTQRIG